MCGWAGGSEAVSRGPIWVGATRAVGEVLPGPQSRAGWRGVLAFGESRAFGAILLLAPAVLFFIVGFVIPVGLMIRYSFYQQTQSGDLASAATLANYVRLGSVDLYRTVVMTTLRASWCAATR